MRLIKIVLLIATPFCVLQTVHADIRSDWNRPQVPFNIYGNTYYVGTHGLGSILITSKEGHILIDGALPESVPLIADNIRSLGFRVEDVKLILNTHSHFDHAGGIAGLQKLSGAVVAASASSAKVLESGQADQNDPQLNEHHPVIAPVAKVRVFKDGEILKVGSLAVTAHLTPGHTPGGTSWTWQSCEQQKCLSVVYADSLNPISSAGFLFADTKHKPNGVQQFEQSFKSLSKVSCDILLAPHPDFVGLFERLAKRQPGSVDNPFVDANACKRYVATGREKLKVRVAEETEKK